LILTSVLYLLFSIFKIYGYDDWLLKLFEKFEQNS
jgi:hypothetical protein